MLIKRYYNFLLKYPWLFLLFPTLLSSILLTTIVFHKKLPNFQDPRKGFVTRETRISQSLFSYDWLLKNSKGIHDIYDENLVIDNRTKPYSLIENYIEDNKDEDFEYEYSYANESNFMKNDSFQYFCGNPDIGYSKLLFRSLNDSSLVELPNIKSMCQLEESLISSCKNSFGWHCDKQIANSKQSSFCCRLWSLGNYIAMINNKTKCLELNENDLLAVKILLTCCSNQYDEKNKTSVKNCINDFIRNTDLNLEFDFCTFYKSELEVILEYIVDKNFLKNQYIENAITYIPMSFGSTSKNFFNCLQKNNLLKDNIEITGISYDFKYKLFDEHLQHDSLFSCISIISVIILLLIFTRSFFIAFCTLITILYSIVLSYFTYFYVLNIHFFPFLNLLTFIILIATGVDNMFVMFQVWCEISKTSTSNNLHATQNKQKTLCHSFKSIFATSATTSTAFLSGYINNVIVLKCFAIFSSLTLLSYFFMALFMMPATIILYDKLSHVSCFNFKLCHIICSEIDLCVHNYFCKIMFFIIVKLKWVWIFIFSFLTIVAFFIVFAYPKFNISQSKTLKLFVDWHPLERFEKIVNDRFYIGNDKSVNLPMTFVWGVKLGDPLSKLDPDDDFKLNLTSSFNMFTSASQSFMIDFCRRIRKTSFYSREPGIKSNSCFMESFKNLMSRRCKDIYGTNLEPCCVSSKFPYSEKVFKHCLFYFLPEMAKNDFFFHSNKHSGPRFNFNFTEVVALVIEFTSNQTSDSSYNEIQVFYNDMNDFMEKSMRLYAPAEIKEGWFTSYLGFYDLQSSLLTGTPLSLSLSIIVAGLFAFMTTGNIILTSFVMLNIASSIIITMAILVLDGWHLDVFESISISLAVGLSIDYTLHYAIVYQNSTEHTRHSRVLETIGISGAIIYAALSTFTVGLCLVFSKILVFKQLSIFLITITSTSWLCSNLFCLSLLYVAGPVGNFGQIMYNANNCLTTNNCENLKHTTESDEQVKLDTLK